MQTLFSQSIARLGSLALTLALPGAVLAQSGPVKLAPVYAGSWTNLEQPAGNTMRITIDKVSDDGTIQGTYSRYAIFCATRPIPMSGKLDGKTLNLKPDFGSNVNCNDTTWTLQVEPDGTLTGTGYSAYRLSVLLKPEAK